MKTYEKILLLNLKPKYSFKPFLRKEQKPKHIKNLSLEHFQELNKLINNSNDIRKVVGFVYKIPPKNIVTLHYLYNGIIKQFKEVVKIENIIFSGGGESKLKRFGIVGVIDQLSKGDVLKWRGIEQLPYIDILTKLDLDKTKQEIEKDEFDKIKRKSK